MRNSIANREIKGVNQASTSLGQAPDTDGNQGLSPIDVFTVCDNFSVELACEGGYNLAVPDSRQVIVYSRKGCHLCEVVKESLTKLSRRGGFTWREIDVDSDGELRREFNDQVPVVYIDGRKAFKYRMDEREFLKKLAS